MDVSSTALFSYLMDDLRAECSVPPESLVDSVHSDFWPGASPPDVMCLRLVKSFYKKYVESTAPDADARCLEKFLASNDRCRNWELTLRDSLDEVLIGEFITEIQNFFYPDGEPLVQSYFDILDRGRAGPGASLGATGEDFYSKFFSSRLTATSPVLYKLYIEYINWFTHWRDGELSRLTSLGLPVYVTGNRLSFVRKTRDISRSICTEPSLNMFFQLGFGELIAARLQDAFGINLSLQPDSNRYLAKVGSLNDALCTIDLESASDSLSVGMANTCFPQYVNDILQLLRASHTDIDGHEVALHMVSSMGNGFTFPLQTAVFASVVRAAARSADIDIGRCGSFTSSWGVFGDDIICPVAISDRVNRLLTILGFRVNSSKSYYRGPFRESCGHDYYNGSNVRGVYIKSLSTPQDRYVAINLLNEWSARTGIRLPRTVGYLVDSVRVLAIPPYENLDAGIRMPSAPLGFWKGKKQRYYYRCYQPVQTVLVVSEDPRVPPLPEGPKKSFRRRISNSSGLLVAFIGGYMNNMRISLPLKQGDKTSYRMRVKVAPFWGPSLEQQGNAPCCDFWRRWNSAVETNLNR